MNKIKSLILSLSLLLYGCLSFTSCSSDEAAVLEVSTTSETINNNNEVKTFTIKANNSWALSQQGDLILNISPISGIAGETNVKFTSSPNTSDTEKSTTITILSKNLTKTVKVTQQAIAFGIKENSGSESFNGTLAFDAQGGEKILVITSNTAWKINASSLPKWIESIAPLNGEGNANVTIKVAKNTNRDSENRYEFGIAYGTTIKNITVTQQIAENVPPTAPTDLKPANGSTENTCRPAFSWEASTDKENDKITYKAYLSADKENWTTIYTGPKTSVDFNASGLKKLQYNTTYYFKVSASDGYVNGTVESQIAEFKTIALKTSYETGDYECLLQSNKTNPIILSFSGDGYTEEELKYNGKFDTDVKEAVEELFSIEPYKTYKEYFTVYKVAAESNQTGISNTTNKVNRDTYFKCVMEGGNSTGISCNYDKAFDLVSSTDYGKDIPAGKRFVCIVINQDTYAGTCVTYSNGDCVGMVPVCRTSSTYTTKFGNIVIHEFGGHGFGMLADEYRYYNTQLPNETSEEIKKWQSDQFCNHYMNLSLYGVMAQSPWAHFAGLTGYSHVTMVEGGYMYGSGVWRPEYISCMEDNRKYFNSPSRFYIVLRILEMSGEVTPRVVDEAAAVRASKIQTTMEKFLEKDIEKTDQTGLPSNTVGQYGIPYNFKPLGKPILKIAK